MGEGIFLGAIVGIGLSDSVVQSVHISREAKSFSMVLVFRALSEYYVKRDAIT